MGMAEDALRRAQQEHAVNQQHNAARQDVQTRTLALLAPLVKEFVDAAKKLGLKPTEHALGASRFTPKHYLITLPGGLTLHIRPNGKFEWGPTIQKMGAPSIWPNNPEETVPQWRKSFETRLNYYLAQSHKKKK